MRRCYLCKVDKPEEEMTKSNACKICRRAASKRHYEKYKRRYIDQSINRQKQYVKDVQELKASKGCERCGETKSWRLSFHHLDEHNKEGNVADISRRSSRKKALEEIEKCIVVCHNCHSDIHHQMRM